MNTPETSYAHSLNSVFDEAPVKQATSLWVERGNSRREIVTRMRAATPHLNIFSTPRYPIANSEMITYPAIEEENGAEAFNEIMEAHGIDALWPHNSARHPNIAHVRGEVHAAAHPDVMSLVDDKVAFAEWLGDDAYRPYTEEALGVNAIAKIIETRQNDGHNVCIKPVIGVFGMGYWRFSDDPEASLLNAPDERIIHPDVYLKALEIEERNNEPQRMVVMDYLPGPEVSVDLLAWHGTPLSHAARTKIKTEAVERQLIQSEHPVLEHSHMLAARLGFHGIMSLQYRLDKNGDWKMLEINPRPAGGSIHSEDAGFHIISDFAKLVTHEIGPDDVVQHEESITMKHHTQWQHDTTR